MNYYSHNVRDLCAKYNAIDPRKTHAGWLKHLPTTPGLACDIGAGCGRDANWLAEQGWDVVAVEPCRELREFAQQQSHANVTWLDDQLPELKKLRAIGYRFNLILLSAVWQHLPPTQRARAFRILGELLAPGGILVISLRHGSDAKENSERGFHPVNAEELNQFARERAIALLHQYRHSDQSGRAHVGWETVVFQLPDDGTGSLPLLRHIIVNDDKSATNKLGLLRTLVRIAEGAPGMVIKRTDDWVEIPFGLVGLYWLKLYIPLVLTHGMVQSPSHRPQEQKGLGFAKDSFYRLSETSKFDLRLGARLSPELARVVITAINDACTNIKAMPANFIKWPGTARTVFECNLHRVNSSPRQHWQMDRESLSQFGTFRVPSALWQSLGQFACWLEPAILNEWARLMMSYDSQYDRSVYDSAFAWDGGRRDTSLVRYRIEHLRTALQPTGDSLHCVWSDRKLKSEFEVDHCFPWSRWYNNDLWNLMPVTREVNQKKKERLPSALLMQTSRSRITQWWELAYLTSELKERFLIEAIAALPMLEEGTRGASNIFEAMLHQRARLRANQQLAEWRGMGGKPGF